MPVVLLDLEGPRGRVEAPGPWTIAMLTDGTEPTLLISVDGSGFAANAVTSVGNGQFLSSVAPLPVGAVFEYAAKAGGESLPVGAARRVTVVAPRMAHPDVGVGQCRLWFRC